MTKRWDHLIQIIPSILGSTIPQVIINHQGYVESRNISGTLRLAKTAGTPSDGGFGQEHGDSPARKRADLSASIINICPKATSSYKNTIKKQNKINKNMRKEKQ